MRQKGKYPVTLSMIDEHPEVTKEIFLNERPHNGSFIGVAKLDGSFMWESVGDLYASLEIGEKLVLKPQEENKHHLPILNVVRQDDTFVGVLQYNAAILPNILKSRGIDVWCHLEAKSFNGGLPEIGVSIYCEKY